MHARKECRGEGEQAARGKGLTRGLARPGAQKELLSCAHLEELAQSLHPLIAASVVAQVELFDIGHGFQRLDERVQPIRVEAVGTQVDFGDRRVVCALLGNHLNPRALHLAAAPIEDSELGVVGLDLCHDLVGRKDLEGSLPPLPRQRLFVIGVHVLICAATTKETRDVTKQDGWQSSTAVLRWSGQGGGAERGAQVTFDCHFS